jgi:hypothetical protein
VEVREVEVGEDLEEDFWGKGRELQFVGGHVGCECALRRQIREIAACVALYSLRVSLVKRVAGLEVSTSSIVSPRR